MAFTLPDLPYSHDALSSGGMSRETLEFHHDKHHKAYVDKLNELIAGTQWENASLEEIVKGTYQEGAVAQNGIFNNASQHWNHAQFWEMMGPNPGKIPGNLESALVESFGSVADFKKKFSDGGVAKWKGPPGGGPWSSVPAAYIREATFSQFTRFSRKLSRYLARALRKSM